MGELGIILKAVIFLICAGIVAAVIDRGTNIAGRLTASGKAMEDNPVVKKYKLSGISCTGTSPRIIRREASGTGIELSYEIDGRMITGVLDDYFVMDDLMARAIVESGKPLEICVHPDNEKVFCLMDELYRQKKEYNYEKAMRRDLTFGLKLKSTAGLMFCIVAVLIYLFIRFSF